MPTTMIGAKEFGRMWRNRLRHGVEPSAVEAVLNSRFLASITAPRAIRATDVQPNNVMTRIIFQMEPLVLNICSTTMAPSKIGKARKISVKRLRMPSTQPPKKPLNAPISVPNSTTSTVANTPTLSEVRVPYTTREYTSHPCRSNPKGCPFEADSKEFSSVQ